MIGEEPAEEVKPPGLDTAVYPVIENPPFEDGAVKETVACPFPATALTDVGALSAFAGVALAVALAAPWPTLFTADTRKS